MTSRPPKRVPWLLVRLLLYIAAAAFLFTRGFARREAGPPPLSPFTTLDSSLTIAGSDLAPGLIRHAIRAYQDDYPRLRITVTGGGTAQGLEALVNRRAQVAFLSRPPTVEEQSIFRSTTKDTALWYPVAVGGMVFVRNAASPVESLSLEEIARLVASPGSSPGSRLPARLYVPDPNLGLWDALRDRLALAPASASGRPPGVVFLESEAAVLDAVRADPEGLGLASSLSLPDPAPGIVPVALALPAGGAEAPTDHAIAYSRYPLFHYFYVASLGYGSIQGSMFVTYLTSDRGQRRLERGGFLPARQVLREVHLSRSPVGAGS